MNIFTILIQQPLANGLMVFYRLLGDNLGLAIIGFTLFLRFVLNPLTKPYMDSMKKMKEHKDQLDKIKQKHKGDRVKLAQAQADFYKSQGINPGAGCLPYILQIVVLISLFRVFTTVLGGSSESLLKFNHLLYQPLKFAADEQLHTQFLMFDMAKPNVFMLPGIPFTLPGLLVVGAAIVQFLSAKITMPYVEAEKAIAKKTPGEADDIQAVMQSSMIYTFPLITLMAGMRFPAGLALYWLLFSLFQLIQQYRSGGWGGLTPWLVKLNLVQLPEKNENGTKRNRKSGKKTR